MLRAALVEEVYGFDDDVQSNALNILVSRLQASRRARRPGVDIHVARGVGYMLCRGRAAPKEPDMIGQRRSLSGRLVAYLVSAQIVTLALIPVGDVVSPSR